MARAGEDVHPIPKAGPRPKTKPRRSDALTRSMVSARSGHVCEVGEPGCLVGATEMHHRLRRSQGGKDTADNFLHLCGPCHRHVHANPDESYRLGRLLRSTRKETE